MWRQRGSRALESHLLCSCWREKWYKHACACVYTSLSVLRIKNFICPDELICFALFNNENGIMILLLCCRGCQKAWRFPYLDIFDIIIHFSCSHTLLFNSFTFGWDIYYRSNSVDILQTIYKLLCDRGESVPTLQLKKTEGQKS